MKSSKVSIKTRSTPASLSFKDQATKLTTVKWSIADHVFLTNHSIKWDHFELLGTGRSDIHCKIKESLFIRGLK